MATPVRTILLFIWTTKKTSCIQLLLPRQEAIKSSRRAANRSSSFSARKSPRRLSEPYYTIVIVKARVSATGGLYNVMAKCFTGRDPSRTLNRSIRENFIVTRRPIGLCWHFLPIRRHWTFTYPFLDSSCIVRSCSTFLDSWANLTELFLLGTFSVEDVGSSGKILVLPPLYARLLVSWRFERKMKVFALKHLLDETEIPRAVSRSLLASISDVRSNLFCGDCFTSSRKNCCGSLMAAENPFMRLCSPKSAGVAELICIFSLSSLSTIRTTTWGKYCHFIFPRRAGTPRKLSKHHGSCMLDHSGEHLEHHAAYSQRVEPRLGSGF